MAHTKKQWLGRALALAVALSALLPFFATYDAAGPRHLSSVFGEKLLICTGDGFKWVKLADLQSGKEKPGSHGDKCPLCYLAHHGVKSLNPALVSFSISYEAAPIAVAYDASRYFSSATFSFNVRAPPVSFIG